MRDELREIMIDFYRSIPYSSVSMPTLLDKILFWHIRERKKWAMGLVGKEESLDDVNPGNLTLIAQIRGKNQCRAEILKKIEEG